MNLDTTCTYTHRIIPNLQLLNLEFLIAFEFLSYIIGLSLHLNSAVHFTFGWHSVKRPNWRHSFKIRLSWCTAWQLRMAFALCTCAT